MDTPQALAKFWQLISLTNKQIDAGEYSKKDLETAREGIVELGAFFQITPEKKREADQEIIENMIDLLIELRQELRDKEDFKASDEIRRRLKKIGVLLEDTTEGVRWRITAEKSKIQ